MTDTTDTIDCTEPATRAELGLDGQSFVAVHVRQRCPRE